MQDLNDKITGGSLTAAEWNQLASEIQNIIDQTGQAFSSTNLNQLGLGIAEYAANGDFYTDSGTANNYVLTAIGGKRAPARLKDGHHFVFFAGADSTGACTVNPAGLGVKSIKTLAGVDPAAGAISGYTELRYSEAADWCYLVERDSSLYREATVTGAAADTIGVTGLNLALHKSYRVEMEIKNALAVNTDIEIYLNGITTPTSYYNQYLDANGAAVTAARNNNSKLRVALPATNIVVITGTLTRDPVGVIRFVYEMSSLAGGSNTFRTGCLIYNGSLVLDNFYVGTSGVSGIDVNSTLRVYRGDK